GQLYVVDPHCVRLPIPSGSVLLLGRSGSDSNSKTIVTAGCFEGYLRQCPGDSSSIPGYSKKSDNTRLKSNRLTVQSSIEDLLHYGILLFYR
ncbi:hypothetical protein scyTo_0012148, partial [Scyliorhinus torazame]|nr:hypothetical protein [Scyliorhinus torazame]